MVSDSDSTAQIHMKLHLDSYSKNLLCFRYLCSSAAVEVQQAELMERYDNLLRGLEEQEQQQVAQRNAIFVNDSSSSSDESSVEEDEEDMCTETMTLPRFFPLQEKSIPSMTLADLRIKFETTFRLYCEKEDHIYAPVANSFIMQQCAAIEPENKFLRFQFHGRPRTVRFAQNYLRTTWLERTIYFHNWSVTQAHGRTIVVRDVPTPLGVHLVRVFDNSLDRSVGLVVEPKGDVHPTLRAVLHTAASAILMKTNGQPMMGTSDFQRVKGTATKIESLEFKCLAKDDVASQYLWDERCNERDRNDRLPLPSTEAIQVDDSSGSNICGDTDGFEKERAPQLMDDSMNIDDASSVSDGLIQRQEDEKPSATRAKQHGDKETVERLPTAPRHETVPQQPKTITVTDVQIGAFPDDQSHFRHFRSKLVGLCNEEYDKTGLLRGCYSSMFKQHRLRFGEKCPMDCPCSYEIPFLVETVEKNQKEKGTTITYSPSGLLGSFAATMMPYVRQWYPEMKSIHHLNQLLPLWRFHVQAFGTVCREGCLCRSSIDLFRDVDYQPLTRASNAVVVYSRSHFEFKCNPIIKEEFGDVALISILPRWWKQHQDLFGDLCNEQCPCASNVPKLLSHLLEVLKKDPKAPGLPSQTSSMATLFFQRFVPKLSEEYRTDSPASILGRLLEMWQIHKLHLRFGKVCRPTCKCEGVWESLFEKGVRQGPFASSQAETSASANEQASSSATTLAKVTAPHLATVPSQQSSPATTNSAPDNSKKRKQCPDAGSEPSAGLQDDKCQTPPEEPSNSNKKQKVATVMELPDRTGVPKSASPEIDQRRDKQEKPRASSQNAAFFGWESFKKRMLPVITNEYGLTGIHPTAILSHIWKRHKDMWGAECNSDCPCLQNVPYLTKSVAADMKKDSRWSHLKLSNYPVGFAGTFIPRFRPLVLEAFPEESPGTHLERLCSMWAMHTKQRNFGMTCSKECECLAAWDIAFLPQMLSPEKRIQRKRRSLELQGEADQGVGTHVSPSTPREAGTNRRESLEKTSPRERLPYEIAFDSTKPLGIYCVTQGKGHNPICKVISCKSVSYRTSPIHLIYANADDPNSSNVDDRISLGTTALASRIEHHDWVAVHSHDGLKREFARACEKASALTIRFINTNVTERDAWTCNKYSKSDWDRTGRWVGKCKTGWDGHLPMLVQPAKVPVRPIQNNELGPHDRNELFHRHGDHQTTVGVRFAKQIESVRWFNPHSFGLVDHGPVDHESQGETQVSAATFEDEVRSIVLHSTPKDAFRFFQYKRVVKKLQEMKPMATVEFGNSVRKAVRSTRDDDRTIDLKYKAFKICLHAVRNLLESKMLKSVSVSPSSEGENHHDSPSCSGNGSTSPFEESM